MSGMDLVGDSIRCLRVDWGKNWLNQNWRSKWEQLANLREREQNRMWENLEACLLIEWGFDLIVHKAIDPSSSCIN